MESGEKLPPMKVETNGDEPKNVSLKQAVAETQKPAPSVKLPEPAATATNAATDTSNGVQPNAQPNAQPNTQSSALEYHKPEIEASDMSPQESLSRQRSERLKRRYEEDPEWSVRAKRQKKQATSTYRYEPEPEPEHELPSEYEPQPRPERVSKSALLNEDDVQPRRVAKFGVPEDDLDMSDKFALQMVQRHERDIDAIAELKMKESIAIEEVTNRFVKEIIPEEVTKEIRALESRSYGKKIDEIADERGLTKDELINKIRDGVIARLDKEYNREIAYVQSVIDLAKNKITHWRNELKKYEEEREVRAKRGESLVQNIIAYAQGELKNLYLADDFSESEYANAYNEVIKDITITPNTDIEKVKRLLKSSIDGKLRPKRVQTEVKKVIENNTPKKEEPETKVSPPQRRETLRLSDFDPTVRPLRI